MVDHMHLKNYIKDTNNTYFIYVVCVYPCEFDTMYFSF